MTVVVHCRKEPYDVYIGRGADPCSGETGRWGNPFRIGRDGDCAEVIVKYRRHLCREIQAGRIALPELAGLEDKRLGCWCAPRPCHGEVLVAAASWAMDQIVAEMDRALAGSGLTMLPG